MLEDVIFVINIKLLLIKIFVKHVYMVQPILYDMNALNVIILKEYLIHYGDIKLIHILLVPFLGYVIKNVMIIHIGESYLRIYQLYLFMIFQKVGEWEIKWLQHYDNLEDLKVKHNLMNRLLLHFILFLIFHHHLNHDQAVLLVLWCKEKCLLFIYLTKLVSSQL